MRCTDCNVHLCVNCYQLFHLVPSIVDKKKQMEKVFLQEQKDRAAQMEKKTPDNVRSFHLMSTSKRLLMSASNAHLLSCNDDNDDAGLEFYPFVTKN
jgi:hypothetical protein